MSLRKSGDNWQVKNYLAFYIFNTKHHHSTKLMQNRISKIRNFLPNMLNVMKFEGMANHNQQHERLK